MVCTLGEIVGAKGQLIVKPLIYPKNKNRKNGFIQVRAEEVEGVNHSVQFQFSATKLDKKDFFGSSDRELFNYYIMFTFDISISSLIKIT